ncbi:hypothetical protein EON67_00620 [archaeon]|nr:MAG: hypothetical protein EON67_00620 [archaeon]
MRSAMLYVAASEGREDGKAALPCPPCIAYLLPPRLLRERVHVRPLHAGVRVGKGTGCTLRACSHGVSLGMAVLRVRGEGRSFVCLAPPETASLPPGPPAFQRVPRAPAAPPSVLLHPPPCGHGSTCLGGQYARAAAA